MYKYAGIHDLEKLWDSVGPGSTMICKGTITYMRQNIAS